MKKKWSEFIPKSVICLFKEPYSFSFFRKDLFAGITVGLITLPLAMAFGIASGVLPERGLYTAVVAGFLISLLGGSRFQIGGPTGAFVVIIYDIVQRQGYNGLVIATFIASILLVIMGLARLGTLIKFIPYPLIIGFTAGIAVVLFSSQVKDFLGLQIAEMPADFLGKWHAIFKAFPTWDPWTVGVSSATLGLILVIRRFFPVVPWGVTSIVLITAACAVVDAPVATVQSRFGEVPRTIPLPCIPDIPFDVEMWRALIPDAIVIAFLAGIESLLSAVIADGMTGSRHRSNCELVGQGIGNFGSILFGGIPATGAIARTATNIKSGAKTPLAGMIHAVALFFILYLFAPAVSLMPLGALAAMLFMICWNMCEIDRFKRLLKAHKGDVTVMLTAFFLTVLVDITVAVEVGMILAAFLFMKRMSDLSRVVPVASLMDEKVEEDKRRDPDAISKKVVPKGVEVYEINGPFFFGIADHLQRVLHELESPPKVFVLRLRYVPVIDASGLHALDEFHDKCKRAGISLILSGVKGKLAEELKEAGVQGRVGAPNICTHIDEALIRAHELLDK
jgi:SulP family sulfate permease